MDMSTKAADVASKASAVSGQLESINNPPSI